MVDCFILFWTAFALAGDAKGAGGARQLAVTTYKMVIGEDETFEETLVLKAEQGMAQQLIWYRFNAKREMFISLRRNPDLFPGDMRMKLNLYST